MLKNKIDIYTYPKLVFLRNYFLDLVKDQDIDWKNIKIIACQHILEPQKAMFDNFLKFGIKPSNIYILGKIYSTNFEVLKEIGDLGINIFQPNFNQIISFSAQHKKNCEDLISKAMRRDNCKTIIIDDGAQILNIFNESNYNNIFGVEQTSSGFRKLEKTTLRFPIYNVARSKTKLEKETPFIVNLGYKRILEKMSKWKIIDPNILVVGLGPIGQGMVDIFSIKYKNIFAYDKNEGKKNLISLIVKNKIDIVIGATGGQIISQEEIKKLNKLLDKRVYFISMSSSDSEFEMWKLRSLFKNFKSRYVDVRYKNIIIANNGFPITFKGNRYESTPEEMEKTICLLFSGALLSVLKKNHTNELIDIPQNIIDLIDN